MSIKDVLLIDIDKKYKSLNVLKKQTKKNIAGFPASFVEYYATKKGYHIHIYLNEKIKDKDKINILKSMEADELFIKSFEKRGFQTLFFTRRSVKNKTLIDVEDIKTK